MGKTYAGNTSDESVIPKKIYVGDTSNHSVPCKIAYCGDSNGKSVEVWRNSTLPSTYQKVEYIFNTGGTQYIDTGVKPNSDTEIYVEVMRTTNNTDQIVIFGTGNSSGNNNYFYALVLDPNNVVRCDYNSDQYGTGEIKISNGYTVNQKVTIDYAKFGGYFYIDGVLKYSSQKTFSSFPKSLALCGFHRNDGLFGPADAGLRIYKFQVWQSRVMIRDMYPCYLKSNTQTVGMYDIIGGQFYGNSGTGIFYKGPDID